MKSRTVARWVRQFRQGRQRRKRPSAFDRFAPYVWERWQAHDPVRMVEDPRIQEALRSLKLLYFDCGSRDQYQLHFGARLLARTLRRAGVPYEYEEFDDDHTNIAYRYNVSLPKLAQVLWEGAT